ncbi:recombinase family protein, partial [Citrobacter youngae]
PSAKGDDKFITTDYLQQCPAGYYANRYSRNRRRG